MSAPTNERPGRPSTGFVIVLAILVAAPTVGDIGSCGGQADPLDATKFFGARLDLTCRRCGECGVIAQNCNNSCAKNRIVPHTFPDGCSPVVHDGDVCLDALEALSCTAFDDFVERGIVPTECDFCPVSKTSP